MNHNSTVSQIDANDPQLNSWESQSYSNIHECTDIHNHDPGQLENLQIQRYRKIYLQMISENSLICVASLSNVITRSHSTHLLGPHSITPKEALLLLTNNGFKDAATESLRYDANLHFLNDVS